MAGGRGGVDLALPIRLHKGDLQRVAVQVYVFRDDGAIQRHLPIRAFAIVARAGLQESMKA